MVKSEKQLEGAVNMNDYIAYCGLDCEICEARLATVKDDDVLRGKVAKLWSKLNNAEMYSKGTILNTRGLIISSVVAFALIGQSLNHLISEKQQRAV